MTENKKYNDLEQCGGELELYLHIPFCVKKCKYCDFLSFPTDSTTMKSYVDALCREIRWKAGQAGGYVVRSIFFGGGTPSLLLGQWMKQIMDTIRENYVVSPMAEISMESNPGTLTKEKLLAYKSAGINRLSIGLQSADDRELKMLGRIHTYSQFLESYQMAVECGFENINIDLMSALPNQKTDVFTRSLEKVLALNPPPVHLSVYSLILEEETELFREYEQDSFRLPSEEEDRKMYAVTGRMLEQAGYGQYEISNYARPGFECIHNQGYWTRVPYLGFGLGAAGFFDEKRYKNETDLRKYIEAPESACQLTEVLGTQQQMEEMMFLGLRMNQGVSKHAFHQCFGKPMEEIYGQVIQKNVENGLLINEADRVYLTKKGMDLCNYVMTQFLLS